MPTSGLGAWVHDPVLGVTCATQAEKPLASKSFPLWHRNRCNLLG